MLTHLSLFSGIGGLDLAAEWAGFKTVGFVERDKYCQRVLAKHWPGVPIWDDVCNVTAEILADAECDSDCADPGAAEGTAGAEESRERKFRRLASAASGRSADGGIQIISGGFPCQPHSVAGKRQASLDERDLWAECARIVSEFRPRWCVFENVPGLLTSERGTFFARVLGDLAALGYGVGWATYGAVDVGAPHRRDRVFIVAHALCGGREGRGERGFVRESQPGRKASGETDDSILASGCELLERWQSWKPDQSASPWESEPDVGRVAHGISPELDGALNAEEHYSQGCSTGNEDSSNVSGVRRNGESRASPSELCGADSLSDLVRSLSRQGGSAGRYTQNETDAALRDMRGGVPAVAHQEERDMRQAMSVRVGAAERQEALGWEVEPDIPRVAVGIKDRVHRLRALGNAVVPQQAYPIFKAIADIEAVHAIPDRA